MWALWLFPTILAIFFGVLACVIIYALVVRPKNGRTWIVLTTVPFGCAFLPIVAIMALAGLSALLQKSDARLFQEVYGFVPQMREDQMLSDDFGTWSNRSIYMKLEVTPHDRQRILDVAPRRSNLTAEQFDMRGETEGFMWWDTACDKPVIYDADGYHDWQTLTVYDCPERQIIFINAFRP